jgi:hypothetical protein
MTTHSPYQQNETEFTRYESNITQTLISIVIVPFT